MINDNPFNFSHALWSDDSTWFSINGLNFVEIQLECSRKDLVAGYNAFAFYKMKHLVDEYNEFFSKLSPRKIYGLLELGLYDGGSVPFWNEILNPEHHVGIDIQDKNDNPYLKDYISRKAESSIKTFWNTPQQDAEKLTLILDQEFGNLALDLVIDDASHFYEESKRSFEIIFPKLSDGGMYIIEDWAWNHWVGASYENKKPLTSLIFEFIECLGTSKDFISSISLFQGFCVLFKSSAAKMDKSQNFKLSNVIHRNV